jgi:hypothetical protein
MVTINSGPVVATDRFDRTPKVKWNQLLYAKESFLATKMKYDCRCLIEFCEEAELVYAELGYGSPAEMIRDGYKLDPIQVELAVAWLKNNEPAKPIALDDISEKIAAARAKPLAEHGEIGNGRKDESRGDNVTSTVERGNATDYTLRRLARDCPEMLDKIEAGELSVNAAAIKAGIRKKPSPAEVCVKAFRKAENRIEALKLIIDTLEPYEAAMVRDMAIERLN